MALQSPGVQVQINNESFYVPAAPGTVPLVVVATAANKENASGTGTAKGTIPATAGTVYVITSQRDLTDTFGTPLFPTVNGGSVHGGELNEYGLQAAYSLLGASSQAYVVRANIDLAELEPSATSPEGAPIGGSYWLDTANSLFGVNEWSTTGSGSFVAKTPLIIDDTNSGDIGVWTGSAPADSFGVPGDYAMYVTMDNMFQLFYKRVNGTWALVTDTFNNGQGSAAVTVSPHTQPPAYTTATTNGSVWVKTTTPGKGANYSVKYYNGTTKTWTKVPAPIYADSTSTIKAMDPVGGGINIPVGTLYIDSGVQSTSDATFEIYRRNSSGPTIISQATSSVLSTQGNITIRGSMTNGEWGETVVLSVSSTATTGLVSAINNGGIDNVSASYSGGVITITHSLGGEIEITDTAGVLNSVGFQPDVNANLYNKNDISDSFHWVASNWKPLVLQGAQPTPIVTTPADGTLWYDSVITDVDIMIQNNGTWRGYRNVYEGTDINGPIVSAIEPTVQSTGSALVSGDIWISTANLDMYGTDIYVYDGATWQLQDVTDHHSQSGWVFADARWSGAGSDTTPDSIANLLLYDYLDPDAPDPALYPPGTRLFNTRRSGFNVKKYVKNYINVNSTNPRDNNASMSDYNPDRWITAVANNSNNVGLFGRHAQRGVVVSELKSLIDVNQVIRDTDTLNFNLIACPGYPETIQNMVGLNTDRGQTALVVGDTPFRLAANATDLNNWGANTALATDNGDNGAVSHDNYLAMFYPSGYTTDNKGNNIVVPPSHMMLRTIINSDSKSYPWFAPAGTRRGGVDNATSVGYVDSTSGSFVTTALYEGLRDVLQNVNINPIATLPGVGIVNYGQKTRANAASALDRINVVRLVAYIRRQLGILAKPYLFEPNDAQTRSEIKASVDNFLLELVGQRALYDFITVCDTKNNTPTRIDASELWLDIAIEPVKAVEFIYIPLRIKNTGALTTN